MGTFLLVFGIMLFGFYVGRAYGHSENQGIIRQYEKDIITYQNVIAYYTNKEKEDKK